MSNTPYDTREFTRLGHKFIARFYYDESSGNPWEESDGHGPVSEMVKPGYTGYAPKRPGQRPLTSSYGSARFYDWQAAIKLAKADGWGLSDEAKAALLERLSRPVTYRRAINPAIKGVSGNLETVTIPGRDPAKPLTKGEIAAEAVRLDFEHLRAFVNDQWHWCGVSVAPMIASRDRLEKAIESAADTLRGPDLTETARWLLIAELEQARLADDEYAPEDFSNALWGIESGADEYLMEVANELADQIIATLE